MNTKNNVSIERVQRAGSKTGAFAIVTVALTLSMMADKYYVNPRTTTGKCASYSKQFWRTHSTMSSNWDRSEF